MIIRAGALFHFFLVAMIILPLSSMGTVDLCDVGERGCGSFHSEISSRFDSYSETFEVSRQGQQTIPFSNGCHCPIHHSCNHSSPIGVFSRFQFYAPEEQALGFANGASEMISGPFLEGPFQPPRV